MPLILACAKYTCLRSTPDFTMIILKHFCCMFFTASILNSYVGNLNRDPPYQNMTSGEKGISLKLHNQFLKNH